MVCVGCECEHLIDRRHATFTAWLEEDGWDAVSRGHTATTCSSRNRNKHRSTIRQCRSRTCPRLSSGIFVIGNESRFQLCRRTFHVREAIWVFVGSTHCETASRERQSSRFFSNARRENCSSEFRLHCNGLACVRASTTSSPTAVSSCPGNEILSFFCSLNVCTYVLIGILSE